MTLEQDAPSRTLSRPSVLASSALGLVLLSAALSTWIHLRMRSLVEERVATSLQVTLDAAVEGVQLFIETERRAAQSAVDDPRTSAVLLACVQDRDCTPVPSVLAPYLRAGGFTRYWLSSSGGEVVANGPVLRSAAPLAPMLQTSLATVRDNATVLPTTLDADSATMHVAVPLRGGAGERAGVLVLELPTHGFSRVLLAARAGRSGETYAFDRQARLLTDSRFLDELKRIGLVEAKAHSAILAVRVRDPGADLTRGHPARSPVAERPLTRMAKSALAGHSGLALDAYRDYRGVSVVGAWRFLAEHEIGIATEVDAREVFGTLDKLKRLFAWIVSALAIVNVALLSAVAYAIYLQRRLRNAGPSHFSPPRLVRRDS